MAVSLSELRDQVYAKLDNNRAFYSEPEVDRAIRYSASTLNVLAGIWKGQEQLASVSGQRIYHTQRVWAPHSVAFGSVQLSRERFAIAARLNPLWAFANPSLPMVWSPIGAYRIMLYPAPSRSGVTITITGLLGVGPAEQMAIPDEYVSLIVRGAWHLLAMKEGGRLFRDAARDFSQLQPELAKLVAWRKVKLSKFRYDVAEANNANVDGG